MSQLAAPQAQPGQPGQPAGPGRPVPAPAAGSGSQPAAAGRPAYVDTPALLNRWQLIGTAVVVVFGLLAGTVQLLGWQADGRAADDTEQLVRVQEIQSSLLRADALATNAFLVGGLEDTADRREYDTELEAALRQVAAAADAQPADREALAALNVEIAEYATAVGQARANNRQGFPVGAEYLSGASAELREEALPLLERLVEANTERAEDAMDAQQPFLLLLLGVLAVAALVWLNRQLARHFRRHVNKGLAVAAAVVLGVAVVGALASSVAAGANDDLRRGAYAVAVAEAEARTAANDAKAQESLRLIQRGSGTKAEEAWDASAAAVVEADPAALADWQDYADAHARIVELDESGQWREAVELATAKGERGSTAPLDAFDDATADAVETSRDDAIDELRSGRFLALALAVLSALLGGVAAVAVARGIGERRREYA